MLDLNLENQLFKQGFHYVAGLDEAGRGPLAGPVVAACVVIDKNFKKSVHLDTDEGNAAGITKKGKGTLVINSKCKNQNAGGPK